MPEGLWFRRYLKARAAYGGEVKPLVDGLAWFEFGAPENADLNDREVWKFANPGMTNDQLDYIADERSSMTEEAWATEYLNRWPSEEQLVHWVSKEDWGKAKADFPPPPGKP